MKFTPIGYLVGEINQASHLLERVVDTSLLNRDEAGDLRDSCRRDTTQSGRGERYVILELHEIPEQES